MFVSPQTIIEFKKVGFFQAMEQGKSYRLVQRGGVVEAGASGFDNIWGFLGMIPSGYD